MGDEWNNEGGRNLTKKLLGDIELNRIYQRDCIEGMRMIPSGSVDMILCDLPYGTTRNKWDSVIPLEPLWEQYERVIKENGAIVLTAQTPFDKMLGVSRINLLRYEWIWEKDKATGHLNAKKMPMKAHENILVFYKKLPTYNPQKVTGHKASNRSAKSTRDSSTTNYGKFQDYQSGGNLERYPRSVLKFNTVNSAHGVLHPTQKPVELFRYLIRTYTNRGEIVLDNCMGSGTTAVAATEEGRDWIGFETEPAYVEIANKRLDSISTEVTAT